MNILLLLLLPLTLFAAPRVNNGGGVWLCSTRSDTNWIQASDFFELRPEHRSREDFGSATKEEIFERKLGDIATLWPDLHKLMRKYPVDFQKITQYVDFSFPPTQDMSFESRPQPSDCPGGVVAYRQLAVYLYNGTLLIDKALWLDEKLSELDRAAILFHEWIYKALRDDRDEQSSARTRRLVALIFSASPASWVAKQITYELNASSHDQVKDELATFPVHPRCEALVDGEIVGSWQPSGKSFGERGEFRGAGYRFTVETSARDGVPEVLSATEEKYGWEFTLDAASARATYLRIKRSQLLFHTGKESGGKNVMFRCWNQI